MHCLSSLRLCSVKRYVKRFIVIVILVTSIRAMLIFSQLNYVQHQNTSSYMESFVNKSIHKRIVNAMNTKPLLKVNTNNIANRGFYLLNASRCFTDGRMNATFAHEMYNKHRVNVCLSDTIDLNRPVPDSRPTGCSSLTYGDNLLSTSVIVTFYDEWPSVLLRTIHSIINRTPSKWLHEIVLVDDASTMESLKGDLDAYLDLFPRGLIKVVRLHERHGLVKARLAGIAEATGEVVVIFDSHMEVNHNWLEPLLSALVQDPKTVAMVTLDYIDQESLRYKFKKPIPRYCFDWRLIFYENEFPKNQTDDEYLRPGVVACGSGFAVRRDYFYEIGGYDDKMNIWGGENLELAWRVWLCGGRMVHAICSRIGHVARVQPYSFPGGRDEVVQYNYKRAVDVWMEPKHRELVYSNFPKMKDIDAGDLTDRLALKERLQCKPFSWYIKNIWPGLGVINDNMTAWGRARNTYTNMCLDNNGEFHTYCQELKVKKCALFDAIQGFSITRTGVLQTQLHCVQYSEDKGLYLGDCTSGPQHIWTHEKYGFLRHNITGLCLDVKRGRQITMRKCQASSLTQKWRFDYYDH